MGLFGSDETDERVQEIVESAIHDSVTAEKVGKKKSSGLGAHNYLNDKPFVDYLQKDEQPHFLWAKVNPWGMEIPPVGVQDGEDLVPNGKFRVMTSLTDERILFIVGDEDGDEKVVLPYSEVRDVQVGTESGAQEFDILTVETSDTEYNIRGGTNDNDGLQDFQQAAKFISEINSNISYESNEKNTSGLSNIDSNSIRNDNVPKKISKLDDEVNSDETVHYAYPILSSGQNDTDEVVTDWCLLATDERLMLYDNEKIASFDYDEIVTTEIQHQANLTALSIRLSSKTYNPLAVLHNSDIDKSELQEFSDFIRNEVSNSDAETVNINEKIGLSNIDINNIQNDDVPKNILKIDDSIKSDETVHYAYGINAAERGDDQMSGLTTGGCLLATDRRLTAYVNETIGSSNLSINYDKIDTVEIEHGAVITKLSVQSTSKTYTFPGFNNIDKSEIHDFADFIRDQASESKSDDASESNVDPTEQLKNIKELHDQGVLTDEEFEEKKQSLLDKL